MRYGKNNMVSTSSLRKLWPIGALALVAIVVVWSSSNKPVCPDDFKTFKESSAAFDHWAKQYFSMHPNASLTDMTVARKQFYIAHNCTAALERFKEGEQANETSPIP